jgi:hypothetical protein
VTLLSGTLADLDLESIAAMTSLGRSSLRLELRRASGDLIGSIVLKAGRVVSATAGGVHGRDALRVMMSLTSDARFELAYEPREVVVGSAVASVDELERLRHRPTPSPSTRPHAATRSPSTRPPSTRSTPARNGAPRFPRSSSGLGTSGRSGGRVQMMQGRLDEFDLLTLLQSIGVGRQLVELEIRNRVGALLGAVRVKSGKVVSAQARGSAGMEAIFELLRASESFEFAAFRVSADLDETTALASVSEISFRFADAALQRARAPSVPVPGIDLDAPARRTPPPPARRSSRVHALSQDDCVTPAITSDAVVMEGRLADYDVRTLLEVLAATRQHARLQIFDAGQPPLGEIALKAGRIVSSEAGVLHGTEAIAFLLRVSPRLKFRVLTGERVLEADEQLGSIHEVLASIPLARASRSESATRILRWAIPLSFAVGGAIVFLVMRGDGLLRPDPAGRTPAVVHELAPRETTAPAEPAPRTEPAPAPVASPPAEVRQAAETSQHHASQPPELPAPAPASDVSSELPPGDANPPARPTLAGAPTGLGIKNAQTALKQLGYDPGPIDNVYGRRTRTAIVRFQRANRLPAHGVLDRDTWSTIVAQLIPKRSP